MKNINGYWVDKNGNRWRDKDEAIACSPSLKNCFFCKECADCSDCNECIRCCDCNDCKYCEDYSLGTNCEYGDIGELCENCKHCTNCTNCKKCINCSDCDECINCQELKNEERMNGLKKDSLETLSYRFRNNQAFALISNRELVYIENDIGRAVDITKKDANSPYMYVVSMPDNCTFHQDQVDYIVDFLVKNNIIDKKEQIKSLKGEK